MAYQMILLLMATIGMFKIHGHRNNVEAVVLPRPPSSEIQAYLHQKHHHIGSPTSSPEHNSLSLVIVTSSELPKQIPAPTQPLAHSSTPQYHEVEQQMSGLPQFKLLWVTQQMDTNSETRLTNINTPSAVGTQKNIAQRTDLLPNMI